MGTVRVVDWKTVFPDHSSKICGGGNKVFLCINARFQQGPAG